MTQADTQNYTGICSVCKKKKKKIEIVTFLLGCTEEKCLPEV